MNNSFQFSLGGLEFPRLDRLDCEILDSQDFSQSQFEDASFDSQQQHHQQQQLASSRTYHDEDVDRVVWRAVVVSSLCF